MAAHEPEFFVTVNYPHRWSSGPSIRTFDDKYMQFESLDAAREYAEKLKVAGYTNDSCTTTYGVQYKTEHERGN